MADLQHATLPEDRLHYPKGASTAANGTFNQANGDGTTSWVDLPAQAVSVTDRLEGAHAANQIQRGDQPGGIAPKILLLGGGGVSPNGSIEIDANGRVTFNEDGAYMVRVNGNIGRRNSTNTVISAVDAVVRKNGARFSFPQTFTIGPTDDAGIRVPYDLTFLVDAVANDYIEVEWTVSDLGGSNTVENGFWWDQSNPLGNIPSASVSIEKIGA